MKITIGVGVSRDAVRMVVTRRARVLWCGEEQGVAPTRGEAGAAVTRLLDAMPRQFRRRGAQVRVALGPSLCQFKPLANVPAHLARASVAQIVHTGVERFFLRHSVPLTTTDADCRRGQWWAAALPTPVVEDVRAGFERRGLSLAACMPTATVLTRALTGTCLRWPDGDVVAIVEVVDGQWNAVRRVRRQGDDVVVGDAIPELLAIDHGDRRWADALGAATVPASEPLAFRPRSARTARRRARTARVLVALAVFAAGAAGLAAPGLAAWYTGRRASRVLDSLQASAVQVARVSHDLQRVSDEEDRVATFTHTRRSFTALLGTLAAALPDSTALVSLHVDSTGGTAVLLSPHGARVLGALDSLRGLAAPQIAGPISSQAVNGSALQRLAVRFRFPGTQPPPSSRRIGPPLTVAEEH